MYKITKFVDSVEYYGKLLDRPVSADHLSAKKQMEEIYMKQIKKENDSLYFLKLTKISRRAETNGYICCVSGDSKYMYDVTDKGHHLIAKKFYFFRVGLWDEALKTYSESQKFFTGAIVGSAITACIMGLVKIFWNIFPN